MKCTNEAGAKVQRATLNAELPSGTGELRRVNILVRLAGDCHVARALSYGLSCSCTSDDQWAVERVALKCWCYPAKKDVAKMKFSESGISLKKLTSAMWVAEWRVE